ncbi:MAG: hypothetical protein L6R48_08300 [Planctomycetes bacterium]|nr:hypothetical protein [Planctomycetota bacterium]
MIRLVLVGETPSLNQYARTHWRQKHRQTKGWELMARSQASIEDLQVQCRRAVRITSYRARLITDHDNLVGGAKGLPDALKRAGLLVDDSRAWCDISYVQRLRSHPENPMPGRSCTVVELENLPRP